MKKKLLTTALAATMVAGSVFSASAATITGAWWTAWTEGYEVTDKVEFDIEVKGGDNNYNNVSAVFANVKTTGTKAPADEAEGYKEYAVVRADSWGWGNGDNKSLDGKDIVYTTDIVDGNGDGDTWDDFRAVMKDAHIDATISKTATGIKLEYAVKGANGVSFNYTATTDVDTSAGLYVFFACDTSEVTVTKVEASAENTTTAAPSEDATTAAPAENATTAAPVDGANKAPGTSDSSVVAIVGLAAVAAAGVAVASKKKVTE